MQKPCEEASFTGFTTEHSKQTAQDAESVSSAAVGKKTVHRIKNGIAPILKGGYNKNCTHNITNVKIMLQL